MADPDWPRLHAIGARLEELDDAGKLDRDAFQKAWAEAEEAAAGNGELLEFLVLRARPGWLPEEAR